MDHNRYSFFKNDYDLQNEDGEFKEEENRNNLIDEHLADLLMVSS